MADTRRLTGGCHCGAVRYAVETDLAMVISCNCSHCAKKGFLLTFTPKAAFTLKTDRSALAEYTFNTGKIRHQFCRTCGVQSFADGIGPNGDEMAAINVRCLDDVDLASLAVVQVNGRDF